MHHSTESKNDKPLKTEGNKCETQQTLKGNIVERIFIRKTKRFLVTSNRKLPVVCFHFEMQTI